VAQDLANVRIIQARWPFEADARPPRADVTLIAHVGYDIEAIGPFVTAMEAAARRLCIAVLMERQPSSIADVFWPPVHSEDRLALPALGAFVELLRARGSDPTVEIALRAPRRFASRLELERFLRRQLWVAPGGEKDRRFREAFNRLVRTGADGVMVAGQSSMPVGVVVWVP
jgi:hypothetical protein